MSQQDLSKKVREAIDRGDELHQLIYLVAPPVEFITWTMGSLRNNPLRDKLVPNLRGLDDSVGELVQLLWLIQAEWPIVQNNPDDHDALMSFSYALDLLHNVSKQIWAVANHQPDNQS